MRLDITQLRVSSEELFIRYRLSNVGEKARLFVSAAAQPSWPSLPFVFTDETREILFMSLVVADCPKDRLIEVPYAYRLEQLEAGAMVEKNLHIRRPVQENRPYTAMDREGGVDLLRGVDTVSLRIGALDTRSSVAAEQEFIGCAEDLADKNYTVVVAEARVKRE